MNDRDEGTREAIKTLGINPKIPVTLLAAILTTRTDDLPTVAPQAGGYDGPHRYEIEIDLGPAKLRRIESSPDATDIVHEAEKAGLIFLSEAQALALAEQIPVAIERLAEIRAARRRAAANQPEVAASSESRSSEAREIEAAS